MGFPLEVEGASVAQFALQVQGNVVEQLPQHAVAEAVVMQIHLQNSSATCDADCLGDSAVTGLIRCHLMSNYNMMICHSSKLAQLRWLHRLLL